MTSDDKRLIAWALRSYAEKVENSPMAKWTPESAKRDAERARQLADQFAPYDWTPTIHKIEGEPPHG